MSDHDPIELTISGEEPLSAYLNLPAHPRSGDDDIVAKSVRLRDVVARYRGPAVQLDFDDDGVLIGIAIEADGSDGHDDPVTKMWPGEPGTR